MVLCNFYMVTLNGFSIGAERQNDGQIRSENGIGRCLQTGNVWTKCRETVMILNETCMPAVDSIDKVVLPG